MFDLKSGSWSWDGFSRLDLQGRLNLLTKTGLLTEEDIGLLRNGGRSVQLLGELIESAIGWFALPLGIAVNFRIDNKDTLIPMVVEETSVVASVNKAAKWVKNYGQLTTKHEGTLAIGQIQLPRLNDPNGFLKKSRLISNSSSTRSMSMFCRLLLHAVVVLKTLKYAFFHVQMAVQWV